jgi:DNA-directed RNA polymerase subunit alpha
MNYQEAYSSLIPNKFQSETDGNVMQITLEPFQKGFAYTLSHALRRILMSSMPGCAISGFKVSGATHQFSSIDGVQEDLVEVMMNLKSLVVSLEESHAEATLNIDFQGPGVIKASDIQTEGKATIINPEAVIATVNTKQNLQMELLVTRGEGYVPATQQSYHDVDMILLDASYSPISRVICKVDDARVANQTDLHKLVLEIESNGTITPEDAVKWSANMLQRQLSAFVEMKVESQPEVTAKSSINPKLFERIDSLELTVRAFNCLKSENIRYIGDLVTKSEAQLLRTPNLGRKSLAEIKNILADQGLSLGLHVEGWESPDESKL